MYVESYQWQIGLERIFILPLLQDAANATLRSETLQETVCDAIITNGDVKNVKKGA